MKRLSTPSWLVAVTICAGIVLTANPALGSPSNADAQPRRVAAPLPPAGPNRPAAVPEDYVLTPLGYFHPSCVQSLTEGERILRDGRLQCADGSTSHAAASCTYPRFTANGTMISSTGAKASQQTREAHPENQPDINGWLENANMASGSPSSSYGGLIAIWRVPPAPRANDGQTLFFFPGLEDIYDGSTSILQPVLTWYYGWYIASWNCCINGVISNSAGVTVQPGDLIYGSITSTCPAGTLSCPTWNVLTLDASTGQSTILADTPSEGQTFDWAFGGVLEPYGILRCADFPSDHSLKFESVTVFDQNLRPIVSKDWSTSVDGSATPWCKYSVQAGNSSVLLRY